MRHRSAPSESQARPGRREALALWDLLVSPGRLVLPDPSGRRELLVLSALKDRLAPKDRLALPAPSGRREVLAPSALRDRLALPDPRGQQGRRGRLARQSSVPP